MVFGKTMGKPWDNMGHYTLYVKVYSWETIERNGGFSS